MICISSSARDNVGILYLTQSRLGLRAFAFRSTLIILAPIGTRSPEARNTILTNARSIFTALS